MQALSSTYIEIIDPHVLKHGTNPQIIFPLFKASIKLQDQKTVYAFLNWCFDNKWILFDKTYQKLFSQFITSGTENKYPIIEPKRKKEKIKQIDIFLNK